mmetsp:Transcript_77832/g.172469  ORF Transcript_77832/g.172469 Transcript_77832/m.172469 type:complete len:226 (+) Transcript_77832:1652-2329(+)
MTARRLSWRRGRRTTTWTAKGSSIAPRRRPAGWAVMAVAAPPPLGERAPLAPWVAATSLNVGARPELHCPRRRRTSPSRNSGKCTRGADATARHPQLGHPLALKPIASRSGRNGAWTSKWRSWMPSPSSTSPARRHPPLKAMAGCGELLGGEICRSSSKSSLDCHRASCWKRQRLVVSSPRQASLLFLEPRTSLFKAARGEAAALAAPARAVAAWKAVAAPPFSP